MSDLDINRVSEREARSNSPKRRREGDRIILRDAERAQLRTTFTSWLSGSSADELGAVFLTGSPGTGKTLTVDVVLKEFKEFEIVKLNSNAIYEDSDDLLSALKKEWRVPNDITMRSWLRNSQAKKRRNLVLVLDEIDRLNNIEILRKVLRLTTSPTTNARRFFVVCMANDWTLPKEISEFCVKMIYKPYTPSEMVRILTFLHENVHGRAPDLLTTKLVSKKAKSGDVRSAWAMLESSSVTSGEQSLGKFAAASKQEESLQLESLTPQQLNVLCMCLSKAATNKHTFEVMKLYKAIMKSYSMPSLGETDFKAALVALEQMSLVKFSGRKTKNVVNKNVTKLIPLVEQKDVESLGDMNVVRKALLKGKRRPRDSVNMHVAQSR